MPKPPHKTSKKSLPISRAYQEVLHQPLRPMKRFFHFLAGFLAIYPLTFYFGLLLLAAAGLCAWLHLHLGWQFYPFQLWHWVSRHATQLLITLIGSLGVVLIANAVSYRRLLGLNSEEYALYQHQHATRTQLPYFIRVHDWLRMHLRFYHWWHTQPVAHKVHVVILVLFCGVTFFTVYHNILPVKASGCVDTVTITVNTAWSTTPQCHGDVTISNGATLTIAGGVLVDVNNLTLGNGVTNGFITAQGDTVNNVGVTFTIAQNLDVKSGSSISADAQGYGAGLGSGPGVNTAGGGAHGGNGGYWIDTTQTITASGGAAYDSVTSPTMLGSGGDTERAVGASGGGAITMTVTGTATVNGTISANSGGTPGDKAGGGAGGTINLTVGTLAGSSGVVSANGGNGACFFGCGGGGGGGRVALRYTTDSYTGGISSLTKRAYGGNGANALRYGTTMAGAGTIFLKASSQTNGDLLIDNNSIWEAAAKKTPTMGTATYDTITLQNKGNLEVKSGHSLSWTTLTMQTNGVLTDSGGTINWPSNNITLGNARFEANTSGRSYGTVTLNSGGVISHSQNTTAETYKVNFTATTLTINSGGSISTDGYGYFGTFGTGSPATSTSTFGAGGAAHGGIGGDGMFGTTNYSSGSAYDSVTNPVNIGSGGGNGREGGGWGGGAIIVTVSGTATINGTISANGNSGGLLASDSAGGGAGGTINLTVGTFSGSTGTVRANGGSGTCNFDCGGGGGGGRIAMNYTTDSYTGGISSLTKTAYGGNAGQTSQDQAGPGTIYLKSSSQTNGDLLIDNNNLWNVRAKKAPTVGTATYDTITIQNKGNYSVQSTHTLTWTTLTMQSNGVLTDDGGTINWPSNNITLGNARFEVNTAGRSYNTVTLNSGGVLSHTANLTSETYKLTVTIATLNVNSGGSIDVATNGFIGGDNGGHPNGYGSGAGLGGSDPGGAAYGGNGGNGGVAGAGLAGGTGYGSITNPINIGSGGGRDQAVGAAGGGAAIITVSGTATINGTITANGTSPTAGSGAGAGSGGTINLTVGTLSGSTGSITANGGNGQNGSRYGGSGGGGRIALFYTTDSYTGGVSSLTKTAYGGSTTQKGGAGTIYVKPSSGNGSLTLSNNTSDGAKTPVTSTMADFPNTTFGAITINTAAKPIVSGNITINSDGALTLSDANTILYIDGANKTSNTGGVGVVMTAASLTVGTSSSINADGNGYSATFGEGRATGNSGAGHGGAGATGTTGVAGTTYDSASNPVILGSGGGTSGGAGGGAFKITTTGNVTVNGTVSANGTGSASGSGSGGSIYINAGCNFNITSGTIRANGGNGSSNGGSGGGGRLALYTGCIKTWTGQTVTASAGTGGTGTPAAGSIYQPPVPPSHSSPSGITSTNITWNWTDNSDDETSFKVYDGSDNSLVQTIASTTTATTGQAYSWSETVIPGKQYSRYVKAFSTSSSLESTVSSTQTAYALANVPNNLTVTNATTSSLKATWGSNSNDSTVQYSFGIDNNADATIDSNSFVQANGSLGASAVWQTYSAWGGASGVAVTGLSADTSYRFIVQARNGTPTTTAFTSGVSLYTLANAPGNLTHTTPQDNSTDTLKYVNSTSILIKVQQNSNPSNTAYALSVTRSAPLPADAEKFVQADGTLGASAVWQSYSSWGGASGETVTGLTENNTYTVKVKARNGDNVETAYSGSADVTTPLAPVPPSAITIADNSNTGTGSGPTYVLSIDWSDVSNLLLDYYIIERSTDGSNYSQLTTSTNTYYDDHTVSQGTTYYYRIKTHTNVPDVSTASNVVSKSPAAPDTTPPVISGVTDAVVSDTQVAITWATDENSTSQVDYGTSVSYGSTATDSVVTSTKRHAIKLSGLLPSTTYHYKVTSADSANNSASSNDVTFSTTGTPNTPDTTPPLVFNVVVGTPATTTVALTWVTDEAGSSFVEYSTNASAITQGTAGAQGIDNSVTSHAVTISGLTVGTTYSYRVKTRDSSGNAGTGSIGTFTTATSSSSQSSDTISAISLNNAEVTGNLTGKVTISWLTERASDSRVNYGITEAYGSSSNKDESVKSHSITLSGLQPDTLYHYTVVSKDSDGIITTSEDRTFKTGFSSANSISNVVVNDPTLTTAEITWRSPLGSTQVLYGTNPENLTERTTEITDPDTNHTVRLTGLTQNTKYIFQVKTRTAESQEVLISLPLSFETAAIPKISGIKLDSVSDNKALIQVTFAILPALLTIEYSDNPQFKGSLSQNIDGNLQSDTKVQVMGLIPDTTYYFRALAKNKLGDSTISDVVSHRTEADRFPPKINSIKSESNTVGSGDSAAAQLLVSVETDEPATVEIKYRIGAGSGYGKSVKGSDAPTTKQFVAIQNLPPAATVHFVVVAKDPRGNTTESQDQIALTSVAQTSVLQVILNALSQTFGWLKIFGGRS